MSKLYPLSLIYIFTYTYIITYKRYFFSNFICNLINDYTYNILINETLKASQLKIYCVNLINVF